MSRGALTAKRRKALRPGAFAFPKTRRYPIHDRSHAINALARARQSGSRSTYTTVRRAVCRRYPKLPACRAKGRKTP